MVRLSFGTAKSWEWAAYIERNVCDHGVRIRLGPLRFNAFVDEKPNQTESIVNDIEDYLTRR